MAVAYNEATKTVHVKRACGCESDIHVKGIKEARFYTKWLSDKKCRECEEQDKKEI